MIESKKCPITANSNRIVYLVKDVKRCRIAFLDGEDECESDDRLLTARQCLHVSHLAGASEAGQDGQTNGFFFVVVQRRRLG